MAKECRRAWEGAWGLKVNPLNVEAPELSLQTYRPMCTFSIPSVPSIELLGLSVMYCYNYCHDYLFAPSELSWKRRIVNKPIQIYSSFINVSAEALLHIKCLCLLTHAVTLKVR